MNTFGCTSPFSGIDHVDISWEPAYAQLHGYTWEEVETSLGKHQDVIVAGRGVSCEQRRAELEHVCGGWSCVGHSGLVKLLQLGAVKNSLIRLVEDPSTPPEYGWITFGLSK